MNIELVKFSKTSANGLTKIGKLGIVITFKDKNIYNMCVDFVKGNFYSKVENMFTPSKNKTYYLYYIVSNLNKILIPRFLLDRFLKYVKQINPPGEISYTCNAFGNSVGNSVGGVGKYNVVEFDTINEPWENKKKIVQHIMKVYEDPFHAGLILDIPTGAGKTVILSHITKLYVEMGYRVHIIVTVMGLIKQTIEEFTDTKYIRQLGGKKCPGVAKYNKDEDKSNYRVLVSSIFSLVNLMKERSIYDEFDDYMLTCIDEPQMITTTNKFEVLKMIQTRNMLGLSASADKSIIIREYIGDIYKPPGFENVKLECNVIKVKYYGSDEYCQNMRRWFAELGEELNCSMQTNLLIEKDPNRNKMIISFIRELLGRHECVLLLSKNLDHIDTLFDMILNAGTSVKVDDKKTMGHVIADEDQDLLFVKWTGVRTEEQVDYAINKANIILATYDSFGVGTNIPKITAMIYSTSYKDQYKQIQFLGRAMRPHKDYNHILREIYDIVDMNVFLKNHFGDRTKVYKNKKIPIKMIKKTYQEYP